MIQIAASRNPDSDMLAGKLFDLASQGDQESFWKIIEPHGGLIYSVALGIMKDPETARDIIHEVYLRAYRDLHNLRHPNRLPSWLHTLTRNLCYDIIRKRSIEEKKIPALIHERPRIVPISDVLISEEETRILEAALAELPEPFRIVIGMKYMNHMKCREIAAILEISVEAVKSRLFEARKLLMSRMEAARSQGIPAARKGYTS